MEIAALVLEYIKVILSWPVVVGVITLVFLSRFRTPIVAVIDRVASIKIPGGGEVLMRQQTVMNELISAPSEGPLPEPIESSTSADTEGVAQQVRSERERARLWEYRFLNYFLVTNTQIALDWLARRRPTVYGTYDTWIMDSVPDPGERSAMIRALETHHLIVVDRSRGDLISVTEKGHEYIEWRGPLRAFLSSVRASLPTPAPLPPLATSPEPDIGGEARTIDGPTKP